MVVPQKCHERGRHGYEGGAFARCSPDTSLVGKAPWLGSWGKPILCMVVSGNKVSNIEGSTSLGQLFCLNYVWADRLRVLARCYEIRYPVLKFQWLPEWYSFNVTCHSSWKHSCSYFLNSWTKLRYTRRSYIGTGQSLRAQERWEQGVWRHIIILLLL